MAVLDVSEIEKKASELALEWTVVEGARLERVFEFNDFAKGLEFVNWLGAVAEELNHHPEIFLTWGKVEVGLTTHKAAGLTQKDFDFATRIDQQQN